MDWAGRVCVLLIFYQQSRSVHKVNDYMSTSVASFNLLLILMPFILAGKRYYIDLCLWASMEPPWQDFMFALWDQDTLNNYEWV